MKWQGDRPSGTQTGNLELDLVKGKAGVGQGRTGQGRATTELKGQEKEGYRDFQLC